MIPRELVARLGLVPLDELPVAGFGGQVLLVATYLVELSLRGQPPRPVEVLAHEGEPHVLLGRDHITERLDGVTFQVSANSFFQTNSRQAEHLFEIVAEAASLTGDEILLDLYSGTGAISLLLARRCRRVYSSSAAKSSAFRKSGHSVGVTTNSA